MMTSLFYRLQQWFLLVAEISKIDQVLAFNALLQNNGLTVNAIFGIDDAVLIIIYIILLIISILLSVLLQPKPPPGPSPQEISAVPTADPSRSVPVLFGTRTIKTGNVIWYGDFYTEPHKTSAGKK